MQNRFAKQPQTAGQTIGNHHRSISDDAMEHRLITNNMTHEMLSFGQESCTNTLLPAYTVNSTI
jgi:hypothetical protein